MRTTITLEKDVAARLQRLRKRQPFKELVNDALRAGLDQIEKRSSAKPARYSITPVEGRPRRTDLDNIAEVIAEIEGDRFR
jgi:metal-responsive CopG/Arc/MetJ family transcriptional regulator